MVVASLARPNVPGPKASHTDCKMRRGREVRQLDIGYPGSSLALIHPGTSAPGL